MLAVIGCLSCFAQGYPLLRASEKTETRKGNKEFDKANYADAEASYKKALDRKNNMPEATFNLGDAVYEQKRYDEAAKQFQLSGQTNTDTLVKAKAYHNLGNTFLEQQKWQEAVKAYKEALKHNPQDKDTKYNLAFANAKLKEQKSENQKNKDNQEKKDDKKEQKSEQNRQDENKQEQNKEQQAKQEKKEPQQKQAPQPKLSKEEAEKLLQALQNEEQKTNQKVQQKQVKVVPLKVQKDW